MSSGEQWNAKSIDNCDCLPVEKKLGRLEAICLRAAMAGQD
jgi:hypothetical protein